MKKFRPIHYLPILLFCFALTKAQTQETIPKVEELLKKMTLDEKIGQLNLPGAGDVITGQAKNSNIAEKINLGTMTKDLD
jgi:beta-glucosidase